jgi:hypothetical protein
MSVARRRADTGQTFEEALSVLHHYTASTVKAGLRICPKQIAQKYGVLYALTLHNGCRMT